MKTAEEFAEQLDEVMVVQPAGMEEAVRIIESRDAIKEVPNA